MKQIEEQIVTPSVAQFRHRFPNKTVRRMPLHTIVDDRAELGEIQRINLSRRAMYDLRLLQLPGAHVPAHNQ